MSPLLKLSLSNGFLSTPNIHSPSVLFSDRGLLNLLSLFVGDGLVNQFYYLVFPILKNHLNCRARMSLRNLSEQFACAGLNMANAKAIAQKLNYIRVRQTA